MQLRNETDVAYLFEEFSLAGRMLFRDGTPVRLGARAVAILSVLLERAGELVSKDTLLDAVWPGERVEEGSLRVHMSALRRALDDKADNPRFIANVAGRGYQFIAPVRPVGAPSGVAASSRAPAQRAVVSRLPGQRGYHSTALLGRDVEAAIVEENLRRAALVSIVGAGGIGKTTLAIAVAGRLRGHFTDGTFFIDLAAVSDPSLLPFAVASTLEISIDAAEPIRSLAERIKGRRMLLVFDNCEHLIDQAALVVEAILRASSRVTVLATSHEPLLTDGEVVVRLLPFALPHRKAELRLADALDYPAVRLFVEHALASDDMLSIGDEDVRHIVDICRRLDGVPLAIEIAAARAGAIGLRELSARLDDRLKLLTGGRRTASPRHQELRSMLDWSYEHLSEHDQTVLLRLSVFASDFSVEAAIAVAAGGEVTRATVTDALTRLLRRSLIFTGTIGAPHLRLPESTRLYLADKLHLAGQADWVRRAHADYLCSALADAEAEWPDLETPQWLERYAALIDDVRNALSWCWSETGDKAIGVRLTCLSMQLGWQLGQMAEFHQRGLAAIAIAETLAPRLLVEEMRLNIACQTFAFFQRLPSDHLLHRAETLADEIGTDRARIEVSIAWAMAFLTSGRHTQAMHHCQIGLRAARADADEMAELAICKVLAQVHHFLGHQSEAVAHATQVLRHPTVKLALNNGFIHSDRRVSMRVMLARALWMTGHANRAREISAEAVELAKNAAVPTMCQVLSLAEVPILIWNGNLDEARPRIEQLREEATRLGFKEWLAWAETFDEAFRILAGETLGVDRRFELHAQELLTFTGIEADEVDLETEVNWCTPERYRARGELALREGRSDAGIALLLKGLDLARASGALAWQLRATISLVDASSDGPLLREALERLATVLRHLPPNDSADAMRARALIARWAT